MTSVDRPQYFRKVIRIAATDSPNVRLGLAQQRAGLEPTGETVVPGVLSWDQYQHRLATWDEVRQCIGLRGEFYEGSQLLLFPTEWLNLAEDRARELPAVRRARAMGVDPAEGGDKSSFSVVDEHGLIEQVNERTPDTNDVVNIAVDLLKRHGVTPDRVCFDRGGGGKQHADRMRAMGHRVRTVGFGEAIAPDPRRGLATVDARKDDRETRYEYKNRRAQMYGELSEAMDPTLPGVRFALPAQYAECRRQLSLMPKLYDRESRLYMLPKNKPPGSSETCLIDLIGHSPDEADSLVLAYHARIHKDRRASAGGF